MHAQLPAQRKTRHHTAAQHETHTRRNRTPHTKPNTRPHHEVPHNTTQHNTTQNHITPHNTTEHHITPHKKKTTQTNKQTNRQTKHNPQNTKHNTAPHATRHASSHTRRTTEWYETFTTRVAFSKTTRWSVSSDCAAAHLRPQRTRLPGGGLKAPTENHCCPRSECRSKGRQRLRVHKRTTSQCPKTGQCVVDSVASDQSTDRHLDADIDVPATSQSSAQPFFLGGKLAPRRTSSRPSCRAAFPSNDVDLGRTHVGSNVALHVRSRNLPNARDGARVERGDQIRPIL